jgi:predicted RNase H-like HicB family nuclease
MTERYGMSTFVDQFVSGHDISFNLEFERDEESGWFAVYVVELPGCVSQGATIQDAKRNIANALESYMEVLFETALRNQVGTTQVGREASLSVESPAGETAKLLVRPRFEVHA